MRIIVCGGRDFSDREALFRVLDDLHSTHGFTLLVHGAARGADRLAGEWAEARGVTCKPIAADWQMHGLRAGPVRNREMLRTCKPEIVVAFPGGSGTEHMIEISRKAGVTVHVIEGHQEKTSRADRIMAQTPRYEGKI
ncbi:DprA-like DNA processing chain A [Rhodobacter phage RcRios]|nr:DprA-like DNA processing chain A [Rhodobacter phage RcRios]